MSQRGGERKKGAVYLCVWKRERESERGWKRVGEREREEDSGGTLTILFWCKVTIMQCAHFPAIESSLICE